MQTRPNRTRNVVPKACDACRRRKSKCDGQRPCGACSSANLACAFNAPRKQGGNRGSRATVLNELRANQEQDAMFDTQSNSHIASPDEGALVTRATDEPLAPSTYETCISIYENRVYRVVSLLHADVLRREVTHMNTSPISRQLIFAFCAYVLNFGDLSDDTGSLPSLTSSSVPDKFYINQALLCQSIVRVAQPDPRSVYISFFLYGAFAGQGDYRQAWFYLREATTLFMMLRNDFFDWYDEPTRSRLFWILVISERAHGVRRNRPITLQIGPLSPPVGEGELGLRYLTSIFRPLNESFFAVWNGCEQVCNKDWLLRLEHEVRTALPPLLEVSNEETANVRISQFWLQIKLWELFPRFGFLSTEAEHECLTFRYPILVGKDLVVLAMKLPIPSLSVHGVGMTEKVFDIACALADVLPFVPYTASQLELNPPDYLTQLMLLIAKLPGGSSKFVPLLLAKVKELLPELMKPMCEAMQMPMHMLNDPMSPDTRFRYEEEVGQGLYADLVRAR